jgi:hypothetical protein
MGWNRGAGRGFCKPATPAQGQTGTPCEEFLAAKKRKKTQKKDQILGLENGDAA